MVVQVTRGQLDWFRRKALSTPNEICAVLIGRSLTSKIVVTKFIYPRIKSNSPTEIDIDDKSLAEIGAQAKRDGLSFLGTIHSHPNWLPVMSPLDMRSAVKLKELTSGIVEVTNRRTRVVFWQPDSSLPCELTYT